mmetsp:Transcript_12276/g.25333  ORF Transcript_12276/g.25333 Transcript_12276/m.25333 type:complete len:697 (+) Transcript_12276:56-2146(+)
MEDLERRPRIRHTDHFRGFPLHSMILFATLFCFLSLMDGVHGWSLSVMHGRGASHPGKARPVLSQGFEARRQSGSKTSLHAEEKDDRISEMDARILQTMLRDNKLDLEQTSNMKKLLERGIRKDSEDEDEKPFEKKEEEEEAYSSQAIKTLADTKFWKAFKRNAGEFLETVAISVTNEIEKGAKVLVGLGFFTWERAKQDVARALPNVATVPQKKVFQLGETSSYVEPKAEEIEEMTPSQRAKSIRQEFTTPADEISAVTAEISKIFQRADRQVAMQSQVDKSKDTRNPFYAAFVEEKEFQEQKSAGGDSTPFYASASLSSTASRGSSRLDAAFKRAQKTKLAREKENPAMKANRLASAAIDSAYQVKTEISSEENVPGYKTKELRESTVDVSRRIAGAAKKTAGFLGGASSFLLGNSGDKQQQLPEAGSSESAKVKADPVDFLDEASYFAFKREEPPEAVPQEDLSSGIIIEDNKVIDTDEPESGGGAFGFLNPFAKREKAEAPRQEAPASTMASSSPEALSEVEIITDAEVVMGNKDSFNFFDADDTVVAGESGDSKDYFTTNGYLDNMEASTATSDDGLRQVTAEVISDDDFDDTVFAQATAVDNMSAEELLRQQAAEEAEENAEPNFVTKATLRTLDVAFLVVEKGIGVAPAAFELAQRVASRATDAKLKDSAGSQIGWEFHKGNIRGENRY